MTKHDVHEIRRRYPAPTACDIHEKAPHAYCVLGAALCYNGDYSCSGFPNTGYAARILQIDPDLASAIAEANDRGDFERAWQLLQEAAL